VVGEKKTREITSEGEGIGVQWKDGTYGKIFGKVATSFGSQPVPNL
jgi:hypothetical protein